ncbi:MAG: hydrogenase [Gammaproteobacteria bacterium GWE2_42_36]|nr:MAG: hydrogenase [Gammaproteobacteria bacterium GWE2_42_36]HCU04713.1 hydrogenase [Coxiellaceae bacterium]
MLKTLKKILRVGIITEPVDTTESHQIESLGKACQKVIAAKFNGSLAIRQVDAGSCNGCELEIQALNNSFYNLERFGIHFVASPRHADVLLVTGPVSRHMEEALRIVYESTPDPKLVIAAGDCAACGGIFGKSYASAGAVSNVISVDLVIPGCPPAPMQLLTALLTIFDAPKHSKKGSVK